MEETKNTVDANVTVIDVEVNVIINIIDTKIIDNFNIKIIIT